MASLKAVGMYAKFVHGNRLASYCYCRSLIKGSNQIKELSPSPMRLSLQLNRQISTSVVQFSQNSAATPSSDFKASEVLAKERYDFRSSEDIEKKRLRLIYQSRKRGMLENGLILASFADKYLKTFDKDQLDQYDRLINLPTNDWDIYYWATKAKPTPVEFETPVMEKLRDHLRHKVSESPELFPNYHKSGGATDQNNDDQTKMSHYSHYKNKSELIDANTHQQYHETNGEETSIMINQIDDAMDDSELYPIKNNDIDLDIDPRTIDISRPESVFSDRIIKYRGGRTVVQMTQWRKDFFVRRIRRTLPAPVSLTGLGDGSNPRFWTQKMKELVQELKLGIGARNSGNNNNVMEREDLGSLEFSSSLIWMIENQPEIVKRDYPEVYELYNKKSEFEELKKSIENEQKKKLADEVSRFPHELSFMIEKERLKIEEYKSDKAKSLIGVNQDGDASPNRPFLFEGESPRFAISGEVDEDYDKYLKHHNVLQNLFSRQISHDAEEYDREAEAWTDLMWHRNYGGSSDLTIPPSKIPCGGCGALLHCNDPGLPGYLPKQVYTDHLDESGRDEDGLQGKKCQRCKFLDTYNVALDVNVSREDYSNVISQLRNDSHAVIVLLVDLLDFPCSVWPGILDVIGPTRKVYLVGNKVDLLPKDSEDYLDRIKESMEANLRSRLRWDDRNLQLADVTLISAKIGFGVEHLIDRLINTHDVQRNIYMLGCTNVGKSTLFNAFLQSDLCGVRENDIITRASTSVWPGTTLNILKFPIAKFQGWQMELRKARRIIQERKKKTQVKRLEKLTNRRQRAHVPHMAMLIDRIEPKFKNVVPIQLDGGHPMSDKFVELKKLKPFDATNKRFATHSFFHDTPGASHKDQILDLLTSEELLRVIPRETIIPRTFSLRPLHSLFISGLARVDVLTATSSVWLTVFASNYLPIHVVETEQAERFYYTYLGSPYLGVPMGNMKRFESWPPLYGSSYDHIFEMKGTIDHGWKRGRADIVLSNAGWVMVNMGPDQDCIVKAHTPEGRGIHLRDPPLLARACDLKGFRIRGTPCFKYADYTIEERTQV